MKLSTRTFAVTLAIASTLSGQGQEAQNSTLASLLAGNARFATDTGAVAHGARRAALANGQKPHTIVVGCSDSRVAPELVLDQDLGDLFVVRCAGNIVESADVGSIEYAVGHLGSGLLVVLGHEKCGAVKATLDVVEGGTPPHGQVAAIVATIRPAVEAARREHPPADRLLDACVRANVLAQIREILATSAAVRTAVQAGKLEIVGMRYSLGTGRVDVVADAETTAAWLKDTTLRVEAHAGSTEAHAAPAGETAAHGGVARTARPLERTEAGTQHAAVQVSGTVDHAFALVLLVAFLAVLAGAILVWRSMRSSDPAGRTATSFTLSARVVAGTAAVIVIFLGSLVLSTRAIQNVGDELEHLTERTQPALLALDEAEILQERQALTVASAHLARASGRHQDLPSYETEFRAFEHAIHVNLEACDAARGEGDAAKGPANSAVGDLDAAVTKVKQEVEAYSRMAAMTFARSGPDEAAVKELEDREGALEAAFDSAREALKSSARLLGDRAEQHERSTLLLNLGIAVLASLIGLLLSWGTSRTVGKAMHGVAVRLQDIAEGEGDLTVELEEKGAREVATIAHWFNAFVAKIRGTVQKIAERANGVSSAATQMTGTAAILAESAEKTRNQSAQVAAAAEQMSANIANVGSSSDTVAGTFRTVAAAVEEMTASIGQVAKNAENAASIAAEAASLVRVSNDRVGALGVAAQEIGRVIETIQDIAEQTNLLALNATIEAARAGEAGKGFSVVANEVKDLARQTAEATQDIRKRIESIQGSTSESVEAIRKIDSVIAKVSSNSKQIATAVVEQRGATEEISANLAQSTKSIGVVANNVRESVTASGEISKSITEVNQQVNSTAAAAEESAVTGKSLATLSVELMGLVKQFKY